MRTLAALALIGLLAFASFAIFVKMQDESSAHQRPLGSSIALASAKPETAAEKAAYATAAQVIAACGKPQKEWTTRTGREVYVSEVQHLWYAGIPVEIELVSYPNDPKPRAHDSIFVGGFPSKVANDPYLYPVLAKRMPCVADWASAMEKVSRESLSPSN